MDDNYLTRAEHNEFMKRYDGDKQRTDKRLELAEAAIKEMQVVQSDIKSINQNIEQILRTLEKQENRLSVLEDRDGSKWRKFGEYVFFAIVGALLGYVAKAVGLG